MLRWLFAGLPVSLFGVYVSLGLLTFALGTLLALAHLLASGEAGFVSPATWLATASPYVAYPILSLLVLTAFITGWPLSSLLKERLAKAVAPARRLSREEGFGKGGSSSFTGILDDWQYRYRTGSLLLGGSRFEPFWRVGWEDDRGFLTIAASRAGKGRGAIIPNLILWPGSALVIDPKGTNAAVTAARRGMGGGRVTKFLGQEVHVVDPFGIVAGVKSSAFNPLDAIDPNSNSFAEEVSSLAEALVVQESEGEPSHWDEGVRAIFAGLIEFFVTQRPGSTLIDIRRAITSPRREQLFEAMRTTGGLAASSAALVLDAGPNERGSFFTTALRNTQWLESKAMQDVLCSSDFDVRDLKKKPMTVYVVLPPEYLEEHKRFMRMFVNLAVRGMSAGKKPKHPVLFLLDEFFSLGRLTQMEKGSALLAGYGMKLWPVIQNLSQIRRLYPQNWETFFSNAGAVQCFGVNDRETSDYLFSRLGQHRVKVGKMEVVVGLREPQEIQLELSREAGRQLIFRSGHEPMLLKRLYYDEVFSRRYYNDDPDFSDRMIAFDMPTPYHMLPAVPFDPLFATRLRKLETKDFSDDGAPNVDTLPPDTRAAMTPPAKLISAPSAPAPAPEPAPPPKAKAAPANLPVTREADAFEKLDTLIGLDEVKRKVGNLISQYRIHAKREEMKLPPLKPTHHLVFTGNPGTGKTTVARLMGEIYREIGILSKGHLIEADRAALVGRYIGETAIKVTDVVKTAIGGVLFVDEAYTLVSGFKNDYGHEAIATLLKLMEDNAHSLVVIVAGYTEEMKGFVASNPGLESRFKTFIDFPDYGPDELGQIALQLFIRNGFVLPDDTLLRLEEVMIALHAGRGKGFGNGRTARNLFELTQENLAERLHDAELTRELITTVLAEDIPPAAKLQPLALPAPAPARGAKQRKKSEDEGPDAPA